MGDFKINRRQHYKWFFDFIWWCLRDMITLACYRYGLIQENWHDFKTRLYFDTNPEMIEITKQLTELTNKNDNN